MPPRFRADQVGSLIRPQSLIDAFGPGFAAVDITKDSTLLHAVEGAITHAVQQQLDLSIRPITSGEYERSVFYNGFFEKLEGVENRNDIPLPGGWRNKLPITESLLKFGIKQASGVIATGKIKHSSSAYLTAWEMLKKTVPQENWKDCKVSIPSLTFEHVRLAHGTAFTPEAYSSDREYFTDLATAYRQELKILYDAGLRSVQIDEPQLSYFILDKFRDGFREDGLDPDEMLDLYIWALNQVVLDKPADMQIGIHICRGNMPGIKGFMEGSYERIAEKVLSDLQYDTFYLEFDDPRSGDFDPLRFLPQGKSVTLGLVTTKLPELEDLETLRKRVLEAAQVIATGQGRTAEEVLEDSLAVSPQCGFASSNKGKGVGSEERMWEKLVLLRDLARSLWKDAI
ncbi:hypothetical protein BX600DRAFT_448080 [Xylariales sp. PMI_506]|nr:hypothetical protein BX600DRAFT_448080 [Xylariales sp. PMI_506]